MAKISLMSGVRYIFALYSNPFKCPLSGVIGKVEKMLILANNTVAAPSQQTFHSEDKTHIANY